MRVQILPESPARLCTARSSPHIATKYSVLPFAAELRHAVADWALELAPGSAHALLMKGESILDQPLPQHSVDEADATLQAHLFVLS